METSVNTKVLLEVKNLNVDYYAANGTVHAVRDVSFTLNRGEILGLAGESGCGKSTLAYAISRLLRPPAYITAGEVLYYPSPAKKPEKSTRVTYSKLPRRGQGTEGASPQGTHKGMPLLYSAALPHQKKSPSVDSIDILQLSAKQLRAFRWNEMAIVFQSAMNALNPVLNIGTQIMDVLKAHRPELGPDQRKKRALELLDLVGIASDRLRSYPHELSGGMRQRVVIAIALALNPELIIMDEPTTALDVVVQREILQLISSLCKEFSTALIFITHDLSLLVELADKVAIMYAGKMVEKASSKDLYEHPRHPYSYGLLNSFPKLHGPMSRMGGIPGSPPDLRMIPRGCPFHPRCPFAWQDCKTSEPALLPVGGHDKSAPTHEGQLVACHLYNPELSSAELPSNADFAAKYTALAEGSRAR